jgi:AcrR family transcriptional regulator
MMLPPGWPAVIRGPVATLPPVTAPTRTRIAADERRHQIVAATRHVTLERGLHDLRVVDVASELDVSTGLIHYHFATKDELIEAMLRETAEHEVASVRASLAKHPRPEDRLERVIELYLPSTRSDPSWVLWIDVWGEALRDVNLRRISEELDAAWVELLAEIIADGVAAGVFRCADPVASAWRLGALLDGLGLQVVLHQATMTRAQMHKHVRRAASLELAYDLPD